MRREARYDEKALVKLESMSDQAIMSLLGAGSEEMPEWATAVKLTPTAVRYAVRSALRSRAATKALRILVDKLLQQEGR